MRLLHHTDISLLYPYYMYISTISHIAVIQSIISFIIKKSNILDVFTEQSKRKSPLHEMLDRSGILFKDDWNKLKTLFDLNLHNGHGKRLKGTGDGTWSKDRHKICIENLGRNYNFVGLPPHPLFLSICFPS